MEHCDFIALRNMLIRTHMTDLKEVTNSVHYENFRVRKLAGVGSSTTDGGKSNRVSNKYVNIFSLFSLFIEWKRRACMMDIANCSQFFLKNKMQVFNLAYFSSTCSPWIMSPFMMVW